MKIALCISGYLRTFKECYSNILENVIYDNDYDVFIHTYNKWGHSQSFQSDIDVNKDIDLDYIKNLKNLKGLVVDKYDDVKYLFENKIKLPHHDSHRVLSMLYKIYQCNELKKKYEIENNFKYDLVVRTRGDFDAWNGASSDDNSLRYNDQFAIGTSEMMDYYSNMYNEVENIMKNNTKSDCETPEGIVFNHLKNINIEKKYFNFYIKR